MFLFILVPFNPPISLFVKYLKSKDSSTEMLYFKSVIAFCISFFMAIFKIEIGY